MGFYWRLSCPGGLVSRVGFVLEQQCKMTLRERVRKSLILWCVSCLPAASLTGAWRGFASRWHQVDTMIVQAIGLLDELDKEINTYAMRVKEWFGWHFPEMAKVWDMFRIAFQKNVSLLRLTHENGIS